MRKIGHNACGNGVAEGRHDDRNCRGHTPSGRNARCVGYDDIDIQTNQLGHQTG